MTDCTLCKLCLSSKDEIMGRETCANCDRELRKIALEIAKLVICTDRERDQLALDVLAMRHES